MINKITRVISALVASVALTSPAVARVESGTQILSGLRKSTAAPLCTTHLVVAVHSLDITALAQRRLACAIWVHLTQWSQHCASWSVALYPTLCSQTSWLAGSHPVSMDSMRRTQWVSQYLRPAAISNIVKPIQLVLTLLSWKLLLLLSLTPVIKSVVYYVSGV